MSVRRLAPVVVISCCLTQPAWAQAPAPPVPSPDVGARVRVVAKTVAPRPIIGTILKLDQTTLQIQGTDQKDPVVVSRAAITRLEVSVGRRSRFRGAGFGALIGFGIGVIPAFVPDEKVACPPTALLCGPIITNKAIGMVYGAIGAGIGAGIGAAIKPGEKWRAVPVGLRSRVGGAHRGFELFWSIEF